MSHSPPALLVLLCAGQGERGQPLSPKARCLPMTGSREAERETHFKDVGAPCLDWLVLLKHTHRHRQAHGFICPLNLWLRHIEIEMTVCVKAEPGGESLFSQT